ncbi:uncharacterized protein LOC115889953 [Sitophilus oryzae]|uniref:Uncharacterized protein LOC115889953 n=1 Tax=Sitophilus oryzae TaxID=7048 RepID=A0A6J2YPF4_SITOR|nr:uncharacterized protein LOC115889953 [Sitophilus oryzae]
MAVNYLSSVPRLTGRENYSDWAFAVENVFVLEGLTKCLDGSETDSVVMKVPHYRERKYIGHRTEEQTLEQMQTARQLILNGHKMRFATLKNFKQGYHKKVKRHPVINLCIICS